jgi:hypothetical protein
MNLARFVRSANQEQQHAFLIELANLLYHRAQELQPTYVFTDGSEVHWLHVHVSYRNNGHHYRNNVCSFFTKPTGCRDGTNCRFQHIAQFNRIEDGLGEGGGASQKGKAAAAPKKGKAASEPAPKAEEEEEEEVVAPPAKKGRAAAKKGKASEPEPEPVPAAAAPVKAPTKGKAKAAAAPEGLHPNGPDNRLRWPHADCQNLEEFLVRAAPTKVSRATAEW